MNREPECAAGLVLGLALAGVVCLWVILAHPTNEERANMIDKLPTKTTQSTGVNWK